MNLFVPAGLRENVRAFGAAGARWLERLPERLAQLEREWEFHAGEPLDHEGAVSWVATVTLEDGSEAILKIGIPHDEARFEAEALQFLDGQGAVRLLRASQDGFALLLERCLPGTDLWFLDEAEADVVAAQILPLLWREPDPEAPFLSLVDLVEEWWAGRPQIMVAKNYDPGQVTRALERGRLLAASQPRQVLLHGDFHPGNVLAAQREPWLAIDPKPLLGDPAYDLAQWLGNRYHAAVLASDPAGLLARQIKFFAERLDLAPTRIAGWALVKSVGWEWGPEATTLFEQVFEKVASAE